MSDDLSFFVSTNVTESAAPPLTADGLMETFLTILRAKHEDTERFAARMLGAFGFRNRRKRNRVRLLAHAARLAKPYDRPRWPPPIEPNKLYVSSAVYAQIVRHHPSMTGIYEAYKPL